MVTAAIMMMMVVEVVRKSWLCIPVISSRLDHFGRLHFRSRKNQFEF